MTNSMSECTAPRAFCSSSIISCSIIASSTHLEPLDSTSMSNGGRDNPGGSNAHPSPVLIRVVVVGSDVVVLADVGGALLHVAGVFRLSLARGGSYPTVSGSISSWRLFRGKAARGSIADCLAAAHSARRAQHGLLCAWPPGPLAHAMHFGVGPFSCR